MAINKTTRFTTNPKTIPISFNTVQELKDYAFLSVGDVVRTLGYSAPDDGGGNVYEVVASGTGGSFGFLFEQLSGSGLEARLLGGGIMEDKTVLDSP